MPIGGFISLFTPIFGPGTAETLTLVLVPLLTLGGVIFAIAFAARGLLDRNGALLAALLVPTNLILVHQLSPLRIDHHGWQILTAAICLLALLDDNRLRSGLIVGAAAALWAHISAEAVPYLALIGALLAVRYILDPREQPRLAAYLGSVALASFLLFAATQSAERWSQPHCDAISWPYLLPLAVMASLAGLTALRGVTGTLVARAALVSGVSAVALAVFLKAGPDCLAGPFATLSPLVRDYWYVHVLEGLPIWRQLDVVVIGMIWAPILGAVGTWLGWRGAADAAAARRWATTAFLLAGSFMIGLAVVRAFGVANLYALPGCAFLLLRLLRRVRPIQKVALRLPLTMGVIMLSTPTFAVIGTERIKKSAVASTAALPEKQVQCVSPEGMSGLVAMPPARILAPLDIGPALLAMTPHSTMATGHHRNDEIMQQVIKLWLSDAENARRFVKARGIEMVVYCRFLDEVRIYAADSPKGFMAQLERGEVPDWLEPVQVEGSRNLRVWRVKQGN
ncbi:MAG TPA: hypothetical protein VD858_03315 [Reyranella sp.]|nr:hypothetical protein [Reyranella sp.]